MAYSVIGCKGGRFFFESPSMWDILPPASGPIQAASVFRTTTAWVNHDWNVPPTRRQSDIEELRRLAALRALRDLDRSR